GVKPDDVALPHTALIARQLDCGRDGSCDEGSDLPLAVIGQTSDQSDLAQSEAAGPQPVNAAHFQVCGRSGYKIVVVMIARLRFLYRAATPPNRRRTDAETLAQPQRSISRRFRAAVFQNNIDGATLSLIGVAHIVDAKVLDALRREAEVFFEIAA